MGLSFPRVARLGGFLALASLFAGCRVYDPALVATGLDAGRDAPPTDCEFRHAPLRPTIADSADGPDVAYGARQVLLDQGAAWETIGLDIDDYCTEAGNLVGECTAAGPLQRDGLEGIDNVFGDALYPLVASAVPDLEDRARLAQEEGRGLPILYVRHWNGTPNDPRVDISIMQAVFSTSIDGASADAPPDVTIRGPLDYELLGGGTVPLPVWDGNDWAWVREDAFLAGDFEQPLIRDDNAYVVDGTFVARLPERVDIIFPTDDVGVLVRLTGATALGHLNADGINLDQITVVGRWSVTDLLSTAENIGICRGTGQYDLLAGQLDRIADVRSMIPTRGEPGLTCNAVSIGVTFYGTRMRIAAVTPGLPLANICSIDGGIPDGGSMSTDAGPPDAGPPDAGPLDAGAAAACVSMGGDAACDDMDPCTDDRCDSALDCVHTPRARAVPVRVFQEGFECVPAPAIGRIGSVPPVCNVDSARLIDGALAGLDYGGGPAGEALVAPIAENVTSCVALDFGMSRAFDGFDLAIARSAEACPAVHTCTCAGMATACPDCSPGDADSFDVLFATDRDAGGCYTGLTETPVLGIASRPEFDAGAIATVSLPAQTTRYVIVCRGGWGNSKPDFALDGVEATCPPP